MTAGILHSFIRSSDVVEIASYSPFVNVCGAIATDAEEFLKEPSTMCLNYFPKYSDSVMGMSRHIWREKHTAFRKSLIIQTEKQKLNLHWMRRVHREL